MQSSTSPRSASRTTTACRACHLRKIKCDAQSPICGQCLRRGTQCEPHHRTRRVGLSSDDERRLRQRVAWLESELAQAYALPAEEVRRTKTGESFVPQSPTECFSLPATDYTRPVVDSQEKQSPGQGDAVEKEVGDIAANVAVLSLNATGEMRFMGGPSGVLFSRLIASTVKKYLYTSTDFAQGNEPQLSFLLCDMQPSRRNGVGPSHNVENTQTIPSLETAKGYLTSYIQWVHLTYPIFHQRTLDSLVRLVYEDPTTLSAAQWTIFYLVMAIGEWNQRDGNRSTSAERLFNCAMTWFDRVLPLDGMEGLQVVLLLAIYSSYRPTGSSQWHLVGIAMRLCIDMGLHRHNPDWKFTPDEWDIRQRVFWVTYAIDRTVCFNLGRPVTLSDDHIDAPFPIAERESQPLEPSIALALHHIRLRIIQTRMINEVYTLGKGKTHTDQQRDQTLTSIQEQLDGWRSQLSQIYSSHQTPHSFKWYERLYYTTTASLHRATPLFPRPTEDSIRKCHEASANAVRTYYYLHRSNEMGQSWILLSGCFLAGITMLYALWSSDDLARSVRLEEVTESCRMCSNVLAVLSATWKASDEFSDTFESLTNITTKRLVERLQRRYRDPLYVSPSPPGMFPLDQGMVLDSLSWPQDLNFHTALTNPDCITEVFDDLLRSQGGIWNT